MGLVSILEMNNDRPTDNQEMISLAHSAGCRVEFLFESKKIKFIRLFSVEGEGKRAPNSL